eukprot:7014417-Lingulodinium_polyedra.AAC.1
MPEEGILGTRHWQRVANKGGPTPPLGEPQGLHRWVMVPCLEEMLGDPFKGLQLWVGGVCCDLLPS